MNAVPATIRIGTRASPLALVQTMLVERMLRTVHPSLQVEIVHITTLGDEVTDRPLAALGERAVFVTAIEDALRDERIDCAVHSAKDLPSGLPADMTIAAVLARADPRDALVACGDTLATVRPGARIGTSSPRRHCQVQALRPDVTTLDIRGNVGTRIEKLRAGEFDAIVLAMAGLNRLGMASDDALTITPFPADVMIPAAAQGALAIEARASDGDMLALLAPLADRDTTIAVTAERAFLATVGGGCHAVVAAFGVADALRFRFTAMLGATDGRQQRGAVDVAVDDAVAAAEELGRQLLANGGAALLATARPG